MSQVRQNYHQDSENGINQHIGELLHAHYTYMGIAFYFDRDDVALDKIHKFFIKLSDKKMEMADKLMKYQNARGGRVILQTLRKPSRDVWGSITESLQGAHNMEKMINQASIYLHEIALGKNDPSLTDFIEEHLLEVHIEDIKQLADLVSNAQRAGPNLGEYMFEREFDS